MIKPHLMCQKIWARLKLAALVLKGIVPTRLNSGDVLHELQAELASARAETGRLAEALADLSLDPETRNAEVSVAREEIRRLNAELGALRAHAAQIASSAASRANESLHVEMPKSVLRTAREEKFKVVDVGAQMLESADHVYTQLVAAWSGKIIGFEPLHNELQKRSEKETAVTMLPHAIGNGQPAVLRVTKFNPASSLLLPDIEKLGEFLALPEMLEVVEETALETRQLDDIPEVSGCRLLKIDVQGGELDVLNGAVNSLRHVLVVFVEVEFLDIYKTQPLFCDIHAMLESNGFELLDLIEPGYGSYRAANNGRLQSKLLWADGLYMRRLKSRSDWSQPQLLQIACAAHFLANKFDYAAHVLAWCDKLYGTKFLVDYQIELGKALGRFK